ncbi:MAG: two-component sensor histidine kinase [Hyphomicrobiales bacterium]|nr:two-component sensor histidine kinase [Hyphomicrobiales bacterium]
MKSRFATRNLSLRWRLVIAFMLVSVMPVLIASYVAAQVISSLFERNVELWLQDGARFVAQELTEAQSEAQRAASIIAETLSEDSEALDGAQLILSATLLASVGYDLIVVYGADGHVVYSYGNLPTSEFLPRKEQASFFPVTLDNKPSLLVGASRKFVAKRETYFVFAANEISDDSFDISPLVTSIEVRAFRVEAGRTISLPASAKTSPLTVPQSVVNSLMGGVPTISAAIAEDDVATWFAGLRDADGRLTGIVACRLTSDFSFLSHFRTVLLFAILALAAAFLSLAVSFVFAELISRPLRALTDGVRKVTSGNYDARVREEGGRELTELEAGFNAMTEQLQRVDEMEAEMRRLERFAALGEATTAIAHEIRNPLGIIKTSSEVVRMTGTLSASSARLIGFVVDEVNRIDQLVQDLIDYVRPKEPNKTRLNLFTDVVMRVVEFAQPELERRHIVCTVSPPSTEALILADAAGLYQAFLNIILNAMEAMPDGGRLTVSVEHEGETVKVLCSDSGIGIPEDVKARIFEPFVTSKPRGTGLGLAKVMLVVKQHGGSIEFDSEPGGGTRFILHFPSLAQLK